MITPSACDNHQHLNPDLLRGNHWSVSQMPPPDPAAFKTYLSTTCSWESNKDGAYSVVRLLMSQDVTRMATAGFCWGAHIAAHLSTDGTMFAAGLVRDDGGVDPIFHHLIVTASPPQ